MYSNFIFDYIKNRQRGKNEITNKGRVNVNTHNSSWILLSNAQELRQSGFMLTPGLFCGAQCMQPPLHDLNYVYCHAY